MLTSAGPLFSSKRVTEREYKTPTRDAVALLPHLEEGAGCDAQGFAGHTEDCAFSAGDDAWWQSVFLA